MSLVISVMFFIILSLVLIDPKLIGGSADLSSVTSQMVLFLLGFLFLILFIFLQKKIVLVEMTESGVIFLSNRKSESSVEWAMIKSIDQVYTFSPPLYMIKLKTGKWYLFSTGYSFVSINGITLDFSKMKSFFEKKLK